MYPSTLGPYGFPTVMSYVNVDLRTFTIAKYDRSHFKSELPLYWSKLRPAGSTGKIRLPLGPATSPVDLFASPRVDRPAG